MNKQTSSHSRWLPVLMLLAFVALISPRLSVLLSYDEAVTFNYFTATPVHALLGYTLPNNHLLNSFLVWLIKPLIGTSEMAIRLPAFYASLLALAAAYKLGQRLGGVMAGTASMIVLEMIYGFGMHAGLARGYVIAVLLTSGLLLIVLYRPRWRYGLMITAMLLIMTLPTMWMLIGAVGLWALRYARRIVAPLGLGAGIGSLFYAPAILIGKAGEFGARFGLDDVRLFFEGVYGEMFGAQPIITAGVVIGVVAGIAMLRGRLRWLAVCIVGVPLGLALMQFATLGTLLYERNYLYLFGWIAPMLGVVAARSFQRYGWIMLVAWIALALPPLMALTTQRYQITGEQQLAALTGFIEERRAPDTGVLVGCCWDQIILYYHPDYLETMLLEGKRQFYVIETNDDLAYLLEANHVEAACEVIEWAEWTREVHRCSKVEP